ncbi:MAG: DNA replication and repair protein RecF [Bdellovibrionales bacterium]|nr:DNA replication and repair protein RecF [Bdellovibrionales bacterium]NQZ17675.1 DNA replication and repair protein RecF [Bdellovibrionales bacterium]
MILERLGLRQFRNIKEQSLVFHKGLNVLRGENGQGKTNLVESIHLLTHGKSFRTNDLETMIHRGDFQGFYLNAQFEKSQLSHEVQLQVTRNKKKLIHNSKGISTSFLRKNFPSVLFSPESLMIVKDSAQKRRELIDDFCVSYFPGFAKLMAEVKKLHRQKNVLLKQVRDEQIDLKEGNQLVESLTQLFLQKSAQLCFLRVKAIKEIRPVLLQEFLNIMDDHYGDISVNYLASGDSVLEFTEEQLLNAMYKRWEELKTREVAVGLCLVGPHKHDVQFNFNDHDARFYCSQGQQRAIILAFKMAHIRLHYAAHKVFPILLLDDVLSELDQGKQKRFLNYLMRTDSQIFLTTTDATAIPEIGERTIFEVNDGLFV